MSFSNTAFLSNDSDCICFSFDGRRVRFRGPKNLQRIQRVKTWDKGYLVVEASYSHTPELVEDYIDLIPILQNLYMDADSFLSPIQNVEVRNA